MCTTVKVSADQVFQLCTISVVQCGEGSLQTTHNCSSINENDIAGKYQGTFSCFQQDCVYRVVPGLVLPWRGMKYMQSLRGLC